MTASFSVLFCSFILYLLSFEYINFWIWKGLQRPFSFYLVCEFLTDFLASGIPCKHINRNLTYSTYSLFFLTPAQHPHLGLSLLWQPVWTYFSGSDIRALTDLFLLSCHTLKPLMVPLPKSPGDLPGNEEHKNIYHCLALELTSNLNNYFHATLIIRLWPFVPCTCAQMDPEKWNRNAAWKMHPASQNRTTALKHNIPHTLLKIKMIEP